MAPPAPVKPIRQRVVLSQRVLHRSHISVHHDLEQHFQNSKFQRRGERLAKSAARRAVTLARATRVAVKTKEHSLAARIREVEEYIGLLRHKHASVQNSAEAADEQLGLALDILHQHGITEQSVSECEDEDGVFLNCNLLPPSSDAVSSDTDLSSNTNTDSDSEDYPVTSHGTGPMDHVGVARDHEIEWLGVGVHSGRVSASESAARSGDGPTK